MKHFFKYAILFFCLHQMLLLARWATLPFPVPLLSNSSVYENESFSVSLQGAFLQATSSSALKIRCQSLTPQIRVKAKKNTTLRIELFNIHPTYTFFPDQGWKTYTSPLRAEYLLSLEKEAEKILDVQFQFPKKSQPLEFWVIGDLEDGYASLCAFRTELQKKKPLFLLSVGDMVNNGTWLRYQMHQDFFDTFELPVFSIIGDGDIDDFPASKKLHLEKRMTLFRHFYGEPQFVLNLPPRLSILALNTFNTTPEDIDSFYQLAQKMVPTRERLLVAHFPPIDPRPLSEAEKKSITPGDVSHRYLKFVQEKSFPLGLYGQLHHFYDQMIEKHQMMVTRGLGARPFSEASYDYFQVQVQEEAPLQVKPIVFASGSFYKYGNKYGFYWWTWWYLCGWERKWLWMHLFLLSTVLLASFRSFRKKKRDRKLEG